MAIATRSPTVAPCDWWRSYFDATYDSLVNLVRDPHAMAAEAAVAAQLLARHGCAGPRLLDAPCAGGTFAIALAGLHGFHVHGVDISADMVQLAQRRAQAAGGSVTFALGDVSQLPATHAYDAAVNWHTSLGYSTLPDDDIAMLAGIRRSLADGGLLLVDTDHLDSVRRRLQPTYRLDFAGGHIQSRVHLDSDGILEEQQCWHLPDGVVERASRARMYTLEQLGGLLAQAGFDVVEMMEATGLEAPTETGRAIVVARAGTRDIPCKRTIDRVS